MPVGRLVLPVIEASVAVAHWFIAQVFDGDTSFVASYQKYIGGLLSYPMYFSLLDVFAQQSPMNGM